MNFRCANSLTRCLKLNINNIRYPTRRIQRDYSAFIPSQRCIGLFGRSFSSLPTKGEVMTVSLALLPNSSEILRFCYDLRQVAFADDFLFFSFAIPGILDNDKVIAPQILSTLFPQTSGVMDEAAKAEEKRKEEEEKKEQQNSWKRTKYG